MTPVSKYLESHSRSILGILIVSIAFNLFLLGAFLGMKPHAKHHTLAPLALAGSHGDYLVNYVSHYLDEKDADLFKACFAAQAEALKKGHEDVHRSIASLSTVFQQYPPDPAALQGALDQLSLAKGEVNDAVSKIMQDAYIKLSPEGRKRLANITQNPM